ncbi:MAG: peptide chain release factor N(5)-glutamine methyltransferase [Gemmataceae bacterium]|nr:peptide chain release factor N(5)-glutamine methyltransferase [Gemmataceae bacterium]
MSQPEVRWTIGKLLEWTEQHFRSQNRESPRLDAQVLLAHALGCQRPQLYVRFDEEPDEFARGKFRELVRARSAGQPVAHLVGRKEFFLLDLLITPATLIPRPATETLVTSALEFLKNRPTPRVLDLGTGSGCIALSIAQRSPGATIVAVDISVDALTVAAKNVERLGVTGRVSLVNSDLFEGVSPTPQFDLIVSNPPYIPSGEISSLTSEVKDWEPRSALDGGPDGLQVIRRIVAESQRFLLPRGLLMVELGMGQHDEVVRLFRDAGFENLRVERDFDRIPRVAIGTKPE